MEFSAKCLYLQLSWTGLTREKSMKADGAQLHV